VKLYVCWGSWTQKIGTHAHPCGEADKALVQAGYEPEVVKVYGFGPLPMFLQPRRKKVKELTGQTWVPVLEMDDGSTITGSEEIIEWARQNPYDPAAANAG
jgi:hypothetical protein